MAARLAPQQAMTSSAASAATGSAAATDEELVLRLRNGDTAAGNELVGRYTAALLRYLQRLTGRNDLAEELHQQTWLSVLDHLGRFDPAGGGFKSWLYRIATNKVNDLWRSRGRERNAHAGLRLVSEELAPDSSHRVDASEQELRLQRALGQLPENQRQVVMLRYYSNLRFVEIADVLGCPLNTALGRMHKAMLKLKQAME